MSGELIDYETNGANTQSAAITSAGMAFLGHDAVNPKVRHLENPAQYSLYPPGEPVADQQSRQRV